MKVSNAAVKATKGAKTEFLFTSTLLLFIETDRMLTFNRSINILHYLYIYFNIFYFL